MKLLYLLAMLPAALAAATNLVVNGDLSLPDPRRAGAPLAWDLPDGLGIQWAAAPDGQGRAIRMDTRVPETRMNESWACAGLTNDWYIPHAQGNAIAETYGLSYYSASFPAASGVTYRVTADVWGPKGAKVWVRGYGEFRGKLTRRYEKVMVCYGGGDAWRTCSETFNPTAHRPEVTELRVMLYAYYPAGVYWFRHVKVEPVEKE
jgi:hypothetical protein